jgi:Na+-driven multidrug efflux pump
MPAWALRFLSHSTPQGLFLQPWEQRIIGIFNVVGGAVSMLVFLNSAMAAASQRFMSYAQGEGDDEKLKKIFNASVVMHLVIGIILVVVLELGGLVLFNGILKIDAERMAVARLIYHFLVISTFVKVISVPYDAVINARENMLFVAVLGIFEAVIKLAIALYVTYTGLDKLASYGFLMAGLAVFLLLITRFYCHKKYSEVTIQPVKYFDKALLKEMTSFGGWSFLSSSSSLITMQGMTILLNSFFGVFVNAAQGVTNQISGQLMAFSNTMLKALNPVIVKSEGENKRENLLKASITGNKISFLLITLFSVPVIVEAPTILNWWLKDVPDFAVIFTRLTLIRLAISQLSITFPTAIGATGNVKKSKVADSIIYIFVLPVGYLLFKYNFAPEAIYYLLIGMVVGLLVSRVYFAHKQCSLQVKSYLLHVVLLSILTYAITIGIAYAIKHILYDGMLRVAIISIVHISISVMLFLLLLADKGEREIIKGFYTKFVSNKNG